MVPVDDPHFLFAGDGAVAVEQALKIAFQYWANRGETGRTAFLALGDAYHGDTIGALSLGDGGVFSAVFEPLCFPVVRTPGYADPGWAAKACAAIDAHAGELAAVVLEPLVQGAAGMLCASAADVGEVGEACRRAGALLVCDEVATGFGRTGTLFASEQCGVRPDLLCLGKGITGGYLAMSATVASGRVFDAFLGCDLGPQTFYHGHSYGGNALAAAVALEHLRLRGRLGRAGQRAGPGRPTRHPLDRAHRAAPRGARDPSARPHGRRRAGAARPGICAGAGGSAPALSSVASCCARSATSSCSCPRSPRPKTRSSASSTR